MMRSMKLSGRRTWVLLVVLAAALGLPLAAEPPAVTVDWKFDVLHLVNGSKLPGLLLRESPSHVQFVNVRRRPGFSTVLIEASIARNEIRHIDRLGAEDREVLRTRIQSLDRKNESALCAELELSHVPWRAEGKQGLRYQSEHFVLVSNAREDIVRRSALRLEQVYAAYTRYLPPRKEAAPATTVYLVESEEEYRKLLASRGLEILNPAFYDAGRNEVVCASDLEELGEKLEDIRRHHQKVLANLKEQEAEYHRQYKGKLPDTLRRPIQEARAKILATNKDNQRIFDKQTQRLFQTLYHEAFHAYLANFVYPPDEGDVPRWLNEGLAQVFETAIVEAGELRVSHADRERLARVKDAVRKGELLPLSELLQAGPQHFLVAHGGDQEISDRYYLAAWLLAFHLTFEQRKLGTDDLHRYVKSLKTGSDPLHAFQELIGQPLPQLEKALHQFALALREDGTSAKPFIEGEVPRDR